ncbi:hypothetical protein C3L33_20271, partial [Rhododendron williamsianum]
RSEIERSRSSPVQSDDRSRPSDNGGIVAAPPRAPVPALQQDLRGLLPEEPPVGLGLVRRLHVPRVLRQAPRPRVHISFVRSVTMDSWSEIQLKKMESGGNDALNTFLSRYGIPKDTEIVKKYNTDAAAVYRDRIQALAEGKPWRDPPVVKKKPPLDPGPRNNTVAGGWDSWDDDVRSGSEVRRNQSVSDFRSGGGGGGGPARSRSSQDIYTKGQLEASAANKESFFSRKMVENESRPEGLPPSQGGKYVGFGSSPNPVAPAPRNDSQGDVISAVSQGFGRLSMVAASAAQSAATVVQAGTKEISSKLDITVKNLYNIRTEDVDFKWRGNHSYEDSLVGHDLIMSGDKVREGGYDTKVNETVTVVTAKTTEIGQKTWGIMKGVMALASQKVEEFSKEGTVSWKADNWQRNESEGNGYYQEFSQESKGPSSGGGQSSSTAHSSNFSSWDDWDQKDNKKEHTTKPAQLVMGMGGPVGMMLRMMDLITSTKAHPVRKLLVTMENQIPTGPEAAFSEVALL